MNQVFNITKNADKAAASTEDEWENAIFYWKNKELTLVKDVNCCKAVDKKDIEKILIKNILRTDPLLR